MEIHGSLIILAFSIKKGRWKIEYTLGLKYERPNWIQYYPENSVLAHTISSLIQAYRVSTKKKRFARLWFNPGFFPTFQAVGLIRREKTILVGTMDDCLQSFSSKGKRLWSQKLPASIKCVEPVDIPSRSVQLTAVALQNQQIILFNDKHVVDCFVWVCLPST